MWQNISKLTTTKEILLKRELSPLHQGDLIMITGEIWDCGKIAFHRSPLPQDELSKYLTAFF